MTSFSSPSFPRHGCWWFLAASLFHAGETSSGGGVWPSRVATGRLLADCVFDLSVVCFCYLGSCFPIEETAAIEIVLDTLLIVVLLSDFYSAFTVSVIFWWLLLDSSRSADWFI